MRSGRRRTLKRRDRRVGCGLGGTAGWISSSCEGSGIDFFLGDLDRLGDLERPEVGREPAFFFVAAITHTARRLLFSSVRKCWGIARLLSLKPSVVYLSF
jgi:hypothetical protein